VKIILSSPLSTFMASMFTEPDLDTAWNLH